MTLNDYQEQAMSTCMDSCANDCYGLFGLTAEVGELNDLIAKGIRKGYIEVDSDVYIVGGETPYAFVKECNEFNGKLGKELGDILWFVAHLAKRFDFSLEEIADMNLRKLAERKASGTIVTHEDH